MKVFLRYTFVFDPLDAWRSREDFDTDLAKFFSEKGLELEKVKHTTESEETAFDERIIFVKKAPEEIPTPTDKSKSVKQQLQGVKPLKKDEKGRIVSGQPRLSPRQ